LIHAESLVGDRQWWLTRPYERKKLLAAKALFVAAWIYLPFVIAEAVILKEGGLSPLAHVAGWFPLLAIASAYGVFPLIAIAAMTSNFARMTLALFAAVIVWLGATALAFMPRGGYESAAPNDRSMWIAVIVIVGAAVATLIQFATRRVLLAVATGAVTVLLATGTAMWLTATRESRIDRAYSGPAASHASMQLALAPYGLAQVKAVFSERPDKIYVTVPLTFSGVPEGYAAQVDDVKAALDDPATGQHWSSPWW